MAIIRKLLLLSVYCASGPLYKSLYNLLYESLYEPRTNHAATISPLTLPSSSAAVVKPSSPVPPDDGRPFTLTRLRNEWPTCTRPVTASATAARLLASGSVAATRSTHSAAKCTPCATVSPQHSIGCCTIALMTRPSTAINRRSIRVTARLRDYGVPELTLRK